MPAPKEMATATRADLVKFVRAFRVAVETEYIDGREPPDWLKSGYDQARKLSDLDAEIWPAPWERRREAV